MLRTLAAVAIAASPAGASPPLAQVATLAALPAVNPGATRYLVAATGQFYRWEATTAAYAALGPGLATLPAAPAPWLLPNLVTAHTAEFLPAPGHTFLNYEITTDGGAFWPPPAPS